MAYDENIYARIVSGEITASEKEQLIQSGEWDEIQNILNATESLSLPALDKEKGYEKLQLKNASAENEKSGKQIKQPVGKTIRLIPYISAIAAAFVGLMAFLFLFNGKTTTLSAPMGEVLAAHLPDESKVTLNAGSVITYNEEKWSQNRTLHLEGEALFEVTKGQKFSVNTDFGQVSVLGTVFNVREWGVQMEVKCYEGKVEVSSDADEVILTPGESAIANEESLSSTADVIGDMPQWVKGISRFENSTLLEVFDELERQYNVKVQFGGKNENYNGVFSHGNLDKALREICFPMNLNYEKRDGLIIVTQKN